MTHAVPARRVPAGPLARSARQARKSRGRTQTSFMSAMNLYGRWRLREHGHGREFGQRARDDGWTQGTGLFIATTPRRCVAAYSGFLSTSSPSGTRSGVFGEYDINVE